MRLIGLFTGVSLTLASANGSQDLPARHAITDAQCNAIESSLRDLAEITVILGRVKSKLDQGSSSTSIPDDLAAELQQAQSLLEKNKYNQFASLFAFKEACQDQNK